MFPKKLVAKAYAHGLMTRQEDVKEAVNQTQVAFETFLNENSFKFGVKELTIRTAVILNDEPYPINADEEPTDADEIVENAVLALHITMVLIDFEALENEDSNPTRNYMLNAIVPTPDHLVDCFTGKENILIQAFLMSLSEDNIIQ